MTVTEWTTAELRQWLSVRETDPHPIGGDLLALLVRDELRRREAVQSRPEWLRRGDRGEGRVRLDYSR